MKKYMPVLVASALVSPLVAQAEGPIDGKVYGKINMSIISEDVAGTSDTYLGSNASRLGFKGKTDLEEGIAMVYQLEYEVDPTEKNAVDKESCKDVTIPVPVGGTDQVCDKDTNIFKQRNAYVGVATSFGTVLGGIHDTPLKLAQGKVDQFNDLPVGDIKNLMNGEVRATDVVAYKSPVFSNIEVFAAVTQYEDDQEGKDDGSSISVAYKTDDLYVAVAVDSEVAGNDVTRVAAQYKLGALAIGAMYNESEPSKGASQSTDSSLISAAYKMDKFTFKGQYGTGDEKGKGSELIGVGVDYKLGKSSKVYLYNASYENDAPNSDKSATGLGIEHKF